MKATDELKKEHEGITRMLRVLVAVSDRLKQKEEVDAEDLDGILEFLSVFVDRCHHGKEEEFLFPALKAAGVPGDGGPVAVMLSEHEHGRTLVAQLKEGVARYTSGDKTAASGIRGAVGEYVDLLTQHIEKENGVLFAVADAKFTEATDAELFEAFERLERERVGPGRHEAFHALLNRLEQRYLI
jgi:hemerythrin-like domain-containing protein